MFNSVCFHLCACVRGNILSLSAAPAVHCSFRGKRNAQTSWDKSFEYSREGTDRSGHLSFWFQGPVVSRWPIKNLSFLSDPFTSTHMLPYYFPVVELPRCHTEKGNCSFTYSLLLDICPSSWQGSVWWLSFNYFPWVVKIRLKGKNDNHSK